MLFSFTFTHHIKGAALQIQTYLDKQHHMIHYLTGWGKICHEITPQKVALQLPYIISITLIDIYIIQEQRSLCKSSEEIIARQV